MKSFIIAAFFISLAFAGVRVSPPNIKVNEDEKPNLTVAKDLNLDSLVQAKTYYNILSKPDFLDRICHCTEASYRWNPNRDKLIVTESCNILASSGPSISQESELIAKDPNFKAKLTRADFGGFLHTSYNILEAANDYSWVAVGDANLEHFWLLSTQPTLDQNMIKKVLNNQKNVNGFDFSDIIFTDQSCHQKIDFSEEKLEI